MGNKAIHMHSISQNRWPVANPELPRAPMLSGDPFTTPDRLLRRGCGLSSGSPSAKFNGLQQNRSSSGSTTASLVRRSLSRPLAEKFHFYLFNVFRNLGPLRGLAHFALFVTEKKIHPVFNQYVLSGTQLRAEPARGLLVRQYRALEHILPADLDRFHRSATGLTLSWLQASLEDGGTFWLGCVDGRLAAYCCTRDHAPATGARPDAYLFALEVLAAFRGRGLAVPFLGEVFRILFDGGVEKVWSETHPLNTPSIRTHRRLGFQFTRKIKVSRWG